MYRLLIADDEALEREGLELIITRAMPGTFEIVHADNGRKAIQLAEQYRPDIVLMDIKMPGIQGLEALQEIRAMNSQVKMALVTAYDYFAYAKQALTLGAKDYIVKPAKQEQIIGLITKLVQELDQERSKRYMELSLRDKVSQLLPLVENELAMMLMNDQVLDWNVEQMAEFAEFSPQRGYAIVIALPDRSHDGEQGSRLQKERVYQTVKSFIALQLPCIVSPIVHDHMAIFVRMEAGAMYSKGETMSWGDRLHQLLYGTEHLPVRIGFGSLKHGIRALRASYLEAVWAAKCGMTDVVHYEDIPAPSVGSEPERMERLASIRNGLADQSAVQAVMRQVRSRREQEAGSVMEQAKAFVHEHFQDNISMEEVAEQVHLSPFYFSKLFKQHFGETFTDYITQLRIAHARTLIEQNRLSLKEICFEVGYKDPNYFSRVFKKVTGVAPTEYRNYHVK